MQNLAFFTIKVHRITVIFAAVKIQVVADKFKALTAVQFSQL